MILAATIEELKLSDTTDDDVLITGEGGTNVVRALSRIPKSTPILNVGYAGSNCLPVGLRVTIGKVTAYRQLAQIEEVCYDLGGEVPCYTSGDFVISTEITTPCVFDMELAYICALGFENVTAIKVVSDNLSKTEYDCKMKGEKPNG